MAKFIYDNARELFLKGQLAWGTDTIKAVLVDIQATPGYVADQAAHKFLADIPAACRVTGTAAPTLAGKTTTAGVAAATMPITFPAVAALASAGTDGKVEAIVLYKDTGNPATSPLIMYCDESSNGTLPVFANGGNLDINFPTTGNCIFKL